MRIAIKKLMWMEGSENSAMIEAQKVEYTYTQSQSIQYTHK